MRVLDIILKDLKVMLRDKKTLGIMIIMPIVITTILGAALGSTFNGAESNSKVQIAIVTEYDEKEETQMLIESLKNNIAVTDPGPQDIQKMIKGLEELSIKDIMFNEFLDSDEIKEILEYQIMEIDEAKEKLSNDEISAIVILPENFVYDTYTNFFTPYRNEIDIEIIGHPVWYIDNQKVEGIFNGFTDFISTMVIGKNVYLETAMENGVGFAAFDNLGKVIEDMTKVIENSSIKLETEKVSKNEPLSAYQFYTVAIAAMFILFTAGEGGKLLLEEKDNLTYQRMVVAGAQKSKIALGKYFTIFSFAVLQIGIMIAYSSLVLGVSWGSPLGVFIITICAGFTIAGLGTMLATISYRAGNYKLADVFSSILVFVLAMFGGSFMPVEVLPKFIRPISNIVPNGIILKSYQKIMLGSGISDILNYLIALIGMGIVFTLLAIYLLNKEERWKYAKYNSAKTSKIEG